MSNKVPSYTLNAIRRHQEKLYRKAFAINREKDPDLVAKLEQEKRPFADLVRELLRQHYKIDQ